MFFDFGISSHFPYFREGSLSLSVKGIKRHPQTAKPSGKPRNLEGGAVLNTNFPSHPPECCLGPAEGNRHRSCWDPHSPSTLPGEGRRGFSFLFSFLSSDVNAPLGGTTQLNQSPHSIIYLMCVFHSLCCLFSGSKGVLGDPGWQQSQGWCRVNAPNPQCDPSASQINQGRVPFPLVFAQPPRLVPICLCQWGGAGGLETQGQRDRKLRKARINYLSVFLSAVPTGLALALASGDCWWFEGPHSEGPPDFFKMNWVFFNHCRYPEVVSDFSVGG